MAAASRRSFIMKCLSEAKRNERKRPFSRRTELKSFRSKISAKKPWVISFASSGLAPSRLTKL
jgi:hypothetical protein